MLEIINFFKKINIFTHAVKEAIKIKQDIDHIDDKESIYIEFNENTYTLNLSFKDIKEQYLVGKDVSKERIYNFLSKHFKYYPYNIFLNGSIIPRDDDVFFKTYSFNTDTKDPKESDTQIIEDLISLYEKQFSSSYDKDKNSIIYFTQSYPYKVKIVFYISTQKVIGSENIEVFDPKDYYDNNFKIYNSSILYRDERFSFIPEFLYRVLDTNPSVKLIINVEGIDSNDEFKSKNIQNFLTKKLADLISDKIKKLDNDNNDNDEYIKYWNKFSYFIKQAVILDPLFFSKIKDNLLVELKGSDILYLNIEELLTNQDQYKYSTKYKLNINPNYSHIEYDYINFLTDQIGSSILLNLL